MKKRIVIIGFIALLAGWVLYEYVDLFHFMSDLTGDMSSYVEQKRSEPEEPRLKEGSYKPKGVAGTPKFYFAVQGTKLIPRGDFSAMIHDLKMTYYQEVAPIQVEGINQEQLHPTYNELLEILKRGDIIYTIHNTRDENGAPGGTIEISDRTELPGVVLYTFEYRSESEFGIGGYVFELKE